MSIPNAQLLFDGVISGLAVALLAVAILLVYRANRVINFAVADMGAVGATLFAVLNVRFGVPYWVALPISLAAGALLGALAEIAVVRRLFYAPRVILLVATIGIAQLAQAITSVLPSLDDYAGKPYPLPWRGHWNVTDSFMLSGPEISVLVVVPALVIALTLVLNRTVIGKTVLASAENAELARLQGVNPKLVSTAVWTASGLIGTFCMILISGQNGSVGQIAALGPTTLVQAMAAAVVARMRSFRLAVLVGVLLGVVQVFVSFNYSQITGLMNLLVLALVLVAVFFVSRSGTGLETSSFSFAPRAKAIPERLRGLWWVRSLDRLPLLLLLVVGVAAPLWTDLASRQVLYTTILAFAICALSVTILTGWAGQLSLGQFAFVGFGAMGTVALHNRGMPFAIAVM